MANLDNAPLVVVADPINEAGIERLRDTCEVRVCDGHEEAVRAIVDEGAAGVVVRALEVTADLLAAAPSLRIVAKHGAGVDNIDIPAATQQGVVVSNTGGTNAPAVAEAAVTLMLAALRKVPDVDAAVRRGEFDKRWTLLFDDLWERKVGIVGCGHIGRTVARICGAGFGCELLGYDPHVPDETMAEAGIARVPDLKELLAQSDVVTLHLPSLPETRHLVDAAALQVMQPHAILVNTSRGETLDMLAVAQALVEGRIGGAGLDVFEPEPPDPSHPIFSAPNTVLSPHVGGASKASRRRSALGAANAVLSVLAGRPPEYFVNPTVWEERRSG